MDGARKCVFVGTESREVVLARVGQKFGKLLGLKQTSLPALHLFLCTRTQRNKNGWILHLVLNVIEHKKWQCSWELCRYGIRCW